MNFLLMAAGRGTRMGGSKALMMFHGEPWIEFQIRQILEAKFENILIITNPETAEAIEELTMRHPKVQIFSNPDPERGPFSSLQILIKENGESSAFISPMDVPLKASTLMMMKESWLKLEGIQALIPSHKEQRGHPVVLSSELQSFILKMPVDGKESRLDAVLRNLPDSTKYILEVEDDFIPLNINTPADLEALAQST